MADNFEQLLSESENLPASEQADTATPPPSFADLLDTLPSDSPETGGTTFGEEAAPESFEDLLNSSEDKGGFITDALTTAQDVGVGFIEGGIQQLGTQFLERETTERITKPTSGTFAADVGAGLGQVTVQGGTIAGFSATGAGIGSVVPGVGTAFGAGVGAGIGAAFTFIQSIRAELDEVEEQVKVQSPSEGEDLLSEISEARFKAAPGVIAGEGLDTVLAFTGVKVLKPLGKAAASAQGVTQISRVGRISNTLKSAAVEGAGEAISFASSQAAVESTLADTDFLREFAEAIPTKETARAAGVGFAVGGIVRGTAETGAARKDADLREGVRVLEEATRQKEETFREQTISEARARIQESEQKHAQNVVEITRAITAVEDPEGPNFVLVDKSVATGEQLKAITDAEPNAETLITEDGEVSIIVAKAIRLEEIQRKADVLRGKDPEATALARKERKSESRAERRLDRAEAIEEDATDRQKRQKAGLINKLIDRTELAEQQAEQAADKLLELREEVGVEGMTKGEISDLLSEVEGLEQFFKNLDNEALKDLGLDRRSDGKIVTTEPTLELEAPTERAELPATITPIDPPALIDPGVTLPAVIQEQVDVGPSDPRPVEDLSSRENQRNTNPARSISAIVTEGVQQVGDRVELQRQRNVVHDAKVQGRMLQDSMTKIGLLNVKLLNSAINRELKVGAQRVLPTFLFPELVQRKQQLLDQANLVMSGQADIDTLPASMHSTINEMRGHVDSLSRRLIEQGIVEGDIVQVIQAGIGTYLNRSYKVFTDPDWAKTVSEDVKENAKGLIRRQMPELSDQQLENELSELLYRHGESPIQYLINKKDDSFARQILKKRHDIPEELRALWGERTSALENYAATVLNISSLIGTNKYLELVKQHGMGDFLFTDARPGFDAPIKAHPTSGGEGLVGPNGERLFTSPELAEEFNKIVSPETRGNLARAYFAAIGGAKFSKTVLSPITQTRNFFGNILIVMANGNFPGLVTGQAHANFKEAGRLAWGEVLPSGIYNPDNPKAAINKAQLEDYIRLGVIGEDVFTRELAAARDDVMNTDGTLQDYVGRQADLAVKDAALLTKNLVEAATTIYRGSDAFWKIVSFHMESDKYRQAFPEWTETQVEERAAEIVRATMPTYSLAPDFVQKLRRVPFIAPFAIFPAEIIRNQFNSSKLILQEIADPRTRAIGWRRAGNFVFAHGAVWGIAGFGKWLTGTGEEEEQDLRRVVADWHKNSTLFMLNPSEDGTKRFFVNMSFSNPYAIVHDAIGTYFRADTYEDALIEVAKEIADPFVQEDLVTRRLADVARNEIEGTSRTVFSENDGDLEKGTKSILHVLGALTPGFVDVGFKLMKESTDKQQEILAQLFGVRIVEQDLIDTAKFRGFGFRAKIRDATQQFGRVLKRREAVSDSDIREAFTKLKDTRSDAYDTMREEYMSLIRLSGGKRSEMINSLVDRAKIGKKNMIALENGLVPRYKMSSAFKDDVKRIPGRMEQISRALGKDFISIARK